MRDRFCPHRKDNMPKFMSQDVGDRFMYLVVFEKWNYFSKIQVDKGKVRELETIANVTKTHLRHFLGYCKTPL